MYPYPTILLGLAAQRAALAKYKQINMINMAMILTPSKDARLPVQLQRAMAAEAEAAREARAKVGFNMVYRVGDGMVKIWPR